MYRIYDLYLFCYSINIDPSFKDEKFPEEVSSDSQMQKVGKLVSWWT